MDYILQTEKLFSYLKFNFDQSDYLKIDSIKRKFSQDFNLIGCFVKDFLILKLEKRNIPDEKLYETFVLFFEKNISSKNRILEELNTFGEYYLMLVFENCENPEILSAISTINLCYCMEVYPLLMQILDNYFNEIVDYNTIYSMLKSLVNVVLYDFENTSCQKIDFCSITIDNVVKISNEIQILGGIAV